MVVDSDFVDPSDLTIGDFVIWYLGKHKHAYVYKMFETFNELRKKSSTKRQMKYSSFRTIVNNLVSDGYIKFEKKGDPIIVDGKVNTNKEMFRKSYYILTEKGKLRK